MELKNDEEKADWGLKIDALNQDEFAVEYYATRQLKGKSTFKMGVGGLLLFKNTQNR